jgi:hypothetical protein
MTFNVNNVINWLQGIPLGMIDNYEVPKDSSIMPVSFPGEDAGKALGIDTMGVIAYINVSGRLCGTYTQINSSIYSIQNILDGNQISSMTFSSPLVSTGAYVGLTKVRRQGNIGIATSATTGTLVDSTALFSTWGVQAGDRVKNLRTGEVSLITSVGNNKTLNLTTGSMAFVVGDTYAVTVSIQVKLLSFKPKWELPGLNYCPYDLSLMQVEN